MIRFAVGGSSGSVGVGCQIVKFRGSIVRTLRHGILLACSMQTIGAGSSERWLGIRIKRKGFLFIALPRRGWSPNC